MRQLTSRIMSTLAQARLTPASHRYLSIVSLRYGTREGSAVASKEPDNGSQILGLENGRKSMTPQLAATRNIFQNNFRASRRNYHQDPNLNLCSTPRFHLHCRPFEEGARLPLVQNNFGQLSRNVYNDCSRGVPRIAASSPTNYSTEMLYFRDVCGTFDCLPKSTCTYTYTINKQKTKARQFIVSPTPSTNHIGCLFSRRSHRDRRKDRDGWAGDDRSESSQGTDKESSSITVVAALGVLGLFNKADISDIESNEQSKLTDEQKMKKMKPIELKIAKGVLAMCDQDYNKASELFHEALRIAQDEKDEEQEESVLNLLAANFFESGDFENAEKLFIDLIKRMVAHDLSPTSPAILELSLKLASIYSRNPATHEKAFKGFKFVISSLLYDLEDVLSNLEEVNIQELSEEKRNEFALLGWSYDWFAKHLLAINDYSGAADLLQRALKISSKVLGPLHDQTLILLNDVGTALAMDNAPEEGRAYIKKAVEGAITSQSKELASFYVNLGLINLQMRRLNEAKRYCEYSMELASKNRDHHSSLEVIELSRSCLNEVERLLEVEEQK